jgi:SAP domain-containing ribonucleoprotein
MPDYGKKTVADLTEILKRRSLPHTGKKADLVARLNEADKSDEAKKSIASFHRYEDSFRS